MKRRRRCLNISLVSKPPPFMHSLKRNLSYITPFSFLMFHQHPFPRIPLSTTLPRLPLNINTFTLSLVLPLFRSIPTLFSLPNLLSALLNHPVPTSKRHSTPLTILTHTDLLPHRASLTSCLHEITTRAVFGQDPVRVLACVAVLVVLTHLEISLLCAMGNGLIGGLAG